MPLSTDETVIARKYIVYKGYNCIERENCYSKDRVYFCHNKDMSCLQGTFYVLARTLLIIVLLLYFVVLYYIVCPSSYGF